MKIIIPNSGRPRRGQGMPLVTFRIVITRDGRSLELETPRPICHREFETFTTTERAAFNAIATHVVATAPAAFHSACQAVEKGGAK